MIGITGSTTGDPQGKPPCRLWSVGPKKQQQHTGARAVRVTPRLITSQATAPSTTVRRTNSIAPRGLQTNSRNVTYRHPASKEGEGTVLENLKTSAVGWVG